MGSNTDECLKIELFSKTTHYLVVCIMKQILQETFKILCQLPKVLQEKYAVKCVRRKIRNSKTELRDQAPL